MEEVLIKRMAVIDENNVVVNLIEGNENSPTAPNTFLVEILQNQYCDKGFTYDGQNFLDANGVAHFYE